MHSVCKDKSHLREYSSCLRTLRKRFGDQLADRARMLATGPVVCERGFGRLEPHAICPKPKAPGPKARFLGDSPRSPAR
eukprot:16384722-Heterocapsa_arctica.AAC.1